MTTSNFKKAKKSLIVIVALFVVGFQSVQASTFLVIVNASNAYSANETDAKNTIKRMYLKQMSKWPGGEKVKAVGRKEDSEEHQAFVKNVIGKSNSDMAGYWMGLKQKTGETPPRAVKSAKTVIKLVGKKAGSFSYISEENSADLSDKVRVLFKY